MQRLKVLLSVFACEPERGSEPGVGWNVARELAKHHEVWALAQGVKRPLIEAELARNPIPHLNFVYYDVPRWAGWWWDGEERGVQLYYYLWQLGAFRTMRKMHREIGFDLTQHVTYVVYWKHSLLAALPVPFVWGPVGGGETAPATFRGSLGAWGKVYEITRDAARWLGEQDPLVKLAARRSAVALATTEETAARLRALGARDVRVLSEAALGEEEISTLRLQEVRRGERPLRFVSVGRLLHWKGFHLGLRAFAQADLPGSEYWILGDGPEQQRLQNMAKELGIADRVKLWGRLPRDEALSRRAECDVLVHPSLHDSGGWVCLEAMALGHPIVCLDLGGPAMQVTKETGIRVPAVEPTQTVGDLAEAMRALSEDPGLLARMGEAGRLRVAGHFNWSAKGERVSRLYEEILDETTPSSKSPRKTPGIGLQGPASMGLDEPGTRS